MCDDKAISPYLQDLPTIYVKKVLGYDRGKPISTRRVLLVVLAIKELSIRDICQTFQDRKVPDSWKIVLVLSNERETKLERRLFAMFVLEMRLHFAITETNISNIIFKYFPQRRWHYLRMSSPNDLSWENKTKNKNFFDTYEIWRLDSLIVIFKRAWKIKKSFRCT